MSLMTKTFTPVAFHAVDTGLSGKRVLVTGASGGIGGACARAFMAEGCEVVEATTRADTLRLAAETAPDVILFDVEMPDTEGNDVLAALRSDEHLRDVPVVILSAKAGSPETRWEETLRANLTASFLTARGFLRGVASQGHGSLVLVGSTAGLVGEAGHADYAAAKSAILQGLLLSLKNEVVRVAPGARVNAVAPGWTESPMTRESLDDETLARVTRTMALKEVAQPEDVARQVVVLASDELSGHVTGQVVTVAGGMEGRVIHEN